MSAPCPCQRSRGYRSVSASALAVPMRRSSSEALVHDCCVCSGHVRTCAGGRGRNAHFCAARSCMRLSHYTMGTAG
eukprot:6211692-Prymnesium_polylepis.1